MAAFQWTASDAVFVTEIDDEHKEIFAAVSALEAALADGPEAGIAEATERLVISIIEHFAHEERLMRAARYESLRWHKQLHQNARRRVAQVVPEIEEGDHEAGRALVEYLKTWLQDHAHVADRMMCAFLRNQRRCMRMTFQAGTKAANACEWVDTRGDRFQPKTS